MLNIGRGGTVVHFRKTLDLKVNAEFLEPESRLVGLEVNNSNGYAFGLITIYVLSNQRSFSR